LRIDGRWKKKLPRGYPNLLAERIESVHRSSFVRCAGLLLFCLLRPLLFFPNLRLNTGPFAFLPAHTRSPSIWSQLSCMSFLFMQ
jgi:hypothetical protein